jgi:hypothetical protein
MIAPPDGASQMKTWIAIVLPDGSSCPINCTDVEDTQETIYGQSLL